MYNRYNTRRPGLSWCTLKTAGPVLLIGSVIIATIVYTIWFHMNYECARIHVETQQQCHTTCWNSGGSGMQHCSTTCHPQEVEVCDQYLPREK
jgi:hypothetical protein